MSAFARVLCLAALPMAWAETPAVTLVANLEASGEVVVRASTPQMGLQLASAMDAVVHGKCSSKAYDEYFSNFHCSKALTRDGLALEVVFDLAPIAQRLAPGDEIQLWLDYPRLGFETSSAPLKEEGEGWRVSRSARFTAGQIPGPIHVQFGYRRDDLAGIYGPLAAIALALLLIAMGLRRSGIEHLYRSLFLVGTIVWLAASSRFHAADVVRILLTGTPLANISAALFEYCPPLFLLAAGAALGSAKRPERARGEIFAELFWGYGMFLFPLTCALGAIPSMAEGDWMAAAPWLVCVPVSFIVCRRRIRANAGARVRQLADGELKDRVMELAAKAGRRDVRIFVVSSPRSQVANAFALLRNGIVLTAPLVRSLTKREVDAVAAHELSHLGHPRRSEWVALAVAAALFQTPLMEILLPGTTGLFVSVLLPLVVFFVALRGRRQGEFAADAGAVALTGDASALISGLARIARNNSRPLEFNTLVEWFSTHPSTHKRIRKLANAGRLDAAEVERLCGSDAPGESYVLPAEDGGAIFTLGWQKANGERYAWTVLLGASGAGLLMAWLLDKFAGAGVVQLAAGIILGSALTKGLSIAVMSSNYARLRARLERKLGVNGQLVGLAADDVPLVYNGYRFSDAGLLWFEGGRLCYRSERNTMALNPADVLEVAMIAAAPSSWRRLQPMVRFRLPESGEIKAFILHPVEWGATPRRLFSSIERWKAREKSADSTSINGFDEPQGQPFHVPTIAQTARGFRIPGGATLLGVMLAGWMLRVESWPAWYALAITACAYIFMFMPALLYRPPSLPAVVESRADGN